MAHAPHRTHPHALTLPPRTPRPRLAAGPRLRRLVLRAGWLLRHLAGDTAHADGTEEDGSGDSCALPAAEAEAGEDECAQDAPLGTLRPAVEGGWQYGSDGAELVGFVLAAAHAPLEPALDAAALSCEVLCESLRTCSGRARVGLLLGLWQALTPPAASPTSAAAVVWRRLAALAPLAPALAACVEDMVHARRALLERRRAQALARAQEGAAQRRAVEDARQRARALARAVVQGSSDGATGGSSEQAAVAANCTGGQRGGHRTRGQAQARAVGREGATLCVALPPGGQGASCVDETVRTELIQEQLQVRPAPACAHGLSVVRVLHPAP